MRNFIIYAFHFSFIHSSMALQSFVGPWSLLHFRNLFYTDGRTPWTSDQPVARPLPTHSTTYTNIHALSGIRTHDPRVRASEDSSYLRPRGHCSRLIYAFTEYYYGHIIKDGVFSTHWDDCK
jgi:hypothetical protein